MSAERRSLWSDHPDYRVDLCPESRRMRVRMGERVLAESDAALRVEETRHAPVWYFPRQDVRLELFERTAHDAHTDTLVFVFDFHVVEARDAAQEGNTATRDDTLFDRCASRVHRILDARFFLFHLYFGGSTNSNDCNTADQFGQSLL